MTTASQITDILVPLDGSPCAERALIAAVPLARRWGTTLSLVTVPTTDRPVDRAYLDALAARQADADVRITILAPGDVVDGLAGIVGDDDSRLLCLSSHGRSGPGRVSLGRITEALIRRAAAPLVVVGGSCSRSWTDGDGPALVCLDVDPDPPDSSEVAATVQWAHRFGRHVEIVAVADPFHGSGAEAECAALARAIAERLPRGEQVHSTVSEGWYPAVSLVSAARRLASPVIIIGPHHGAGLGAVHDVVRGVLAGATCPVLILPRPAGAADDQGAQAASS